MHKRLGGFLVVCVVGSAMTLAAAEPAFAKKLSPGVVACKLMVRAQSPTITSAQTDILTGKAKVQLRKVDAKAARKALKAKNSYTALVNYCSSHYSVAQIGVVVTTTSSTTTTTTTRPPLDPAVAELFYKSGTRDIPYDELIKDPTALKGQAMHGVAKVFQYDTRTGLTHLLVSVTVKNPGQYEFWTDNVLLTLSSAALGNGIDNKDIVEFWGTVAGAYSYETAAAGTNTVPEIAVNYMNLVEKRDQ